MLKLRYKTEDWREALIDVVCQVESDLDVEFDMICYDECADELCNDVLRRLDGAGVEYEQAYQQSVGSCVIVQSGTDSERAEFDRAFDAACEAVKESVIRTAKSLRDSD